MQARRLFLALPLPPPVAESIAENAPHGAGIDPLAPEDLHVTLAFLGRVEGPAYPEALAALETIEGPRFTIRLSGCGVFPDTRTPRVVWLGVPPEPELLSLQKSVMKSLLDAGLAPDPREYRPHVTTARLAQPNLVRLADYLRRHEKFDAPPIPIDRVCLYASHGLPGRTRYEVLETRLLGTLYERLMG